MNKGLFFLLQLFQTPARQYFVRNSRYSCLKNDFSGQERLPVCLKDANYHITYSKLRYEVLAVP